MSVQQSVNRYELKYVVHHAQARELLAAVAGHVRPDTHGGADGWYKVSSVYFDSAGLRCYEEKLDGEKWRRKVRLRTYGRGTEDAFLEIKERYNLNVRKRRHRAPLEELETLVRRMLGGEPPPPGSALLDEVFLLLHRDRLTPRVLVSYQRAAFLDRHHRGLRITLDRNLKCRSHDLDLRSAGLAGRHALPPTLHVLEVKFNEGLPRWLCTVLNRFDLQVQRYSKYCASVERLELMRRPAAATGRSGTPGS